MKWGLIPFWTKRPPDYPSQLRTINCRDDSLAQPAGMWNTMKQRKRCIVIAEGFYEWLKKPNHKVKVPHFVKRKDGQLMCFAGLWDCVRYEGMDDNDRIWSYTIITTDSNPQLRFLHDRMPVILDNGSDDMKVWLDPARSTWSKDLQALLKPYKGDLECYPVDSAVGKVGNNSPTFVVPIDSKENKKNIANFFPNQKKAIQGAAEKDTVKEEAHNVKTMSTQIKTEQDEARGTDDNVEGTENNAPLPKPVDESVNKEPAQGIKREFPASQEMADINAPPPKKQPRIDDNYAYLKSPERASAMSRTRSATSNGSAAKASTKSSSDSSTRKITAFFGN